MDDHLMDPGDQVEPGELEPSGRPSGRMAERTPPRRARRAELRARVEQEARRVAERRGVEVAMEEPRRASDIAVMWFRGDRASVLRAVGAWRPDAPVEVRIAHAGSLGVRYELALYVLPRAVGETRAA